MSTFDCRHDLLCGVPHHQHCSLKALDIEVFVQVTTDLRSCFDCSVKRLGVLLHGEILDHLLLNHSSHARECVHDLLLLNLGFAEVLRRVSVAALCSLCLQLALLFSPAVGCALVLPAVGYALSVLLIILQIVDVLLAVLLPVLSPLLLAVSLFLLLFRVTLW